MIQVFESWSGITTAANSKDIIVKSNLTKVTSEQIEKGKCKAYKLIIWK